MAVFDSFFDLVIIGAAGIDCARSDQIFWFKDGTCTSTRRRMVGKHRLSVRWHGPPSPGSPRAGPRGGWSTGRPFDPVACAQLLEERLPKQSVVAGQDARSEVVSWQLVGRGPVHPSRALAPHPLRGENRRFPEIHPEVSTE